MDYCNDITLNNNIIFCNIENGVYMWNSSNVPLVNNDISDNRNGISMDSCSNVTIYNNILSSNHYGVFVWICNNITLSNNTLSYNDLAGVDMTYCSNVAMLSNTFIHCGLVIYGVSLNHYNHTVVGNIVNGKPLRYIFNQTNTIIEDGGQVIVVYSQGIIIRNLDLSYASAGTEILFSSNVTIYSNIISGNHYGVVIVSCNDVTVHNNTISENYYGVLAIRCSNITVLNNTLSGNYYGVYMVSCSDVTVFLNKFIDNTNQAYDDGANSFDNGEVGNYWSDYTGVDSDGDGIGDTPYHIDDDSIDRYPLIKLVGLDTTPPVIEDVEYSPLYPTDVEDVTVSAIITDNVGITSVILSYYNECVWENVTMRLSNGFYVAVIPAMATGTTVTFVIYATDFSGNVASYAESYTVATVVGEGTYIVLNETETLNMTVIVNSSEPINVNVTMYENITELGYPAEELFNISYFKVLNKSLSIISNVTSTPKSNTTIHIRIYYTDEEITTLGVDESQLRMYFWNETEQEWQICEITGVNTEENYVWANVTHLTLFIVLSDITPPTSELAIGPYYVDETGNVYVTSNTEFTITASDAVSGVAQTYYRINGSDWGEYFGSFNLTGQDGTYIIDYYSVDLAGNDETPRSVTVILVSFKVNSYMTDSDFNPLSYFDVVFAKDKSGGYKLVATNPGQFYYSIEIVNNWPIAVNMTINVSIPEDFVLKGAVPIHVYLDGTDITDLCKIDGTRITVMNIPSGSMVYVNIHVDYGLKGALFGSLDEFELKGYIFDVVVSSSGGSPSVPGGGLIGTHDSSATLIAHQKKTTAIAGFVMDAYGNPIVGVMVELFNSNGNWIATAVTDENGFYYFIDIEPGDYVVQVTYNGQIYSQAITVAKNELAQVDFKIE